MSTPDNPSLEDPDHPRSVWQRSTTRRFIWWLFSWRTLRRLLLFSAGLITLVALFYVVENFRGKRAWDRHKEAMTAQGEVLDLAAMAPPPVADERNLAMIPLLKPLFQYTRTDQGLRWTDSNGYARVQSIKAEIPVRGRDVRLVTGDPDRGTFADLETDRQFYLGNPNYPQPAASGTPAEDILTALGKFDAELRELREAAAVRPECRFPVNYEEDPPAMILLPHLAPLKQIAIVVQLRAIARLEQQQIPEAWADLQLGLTLADAVRGEPILISLLVRAAILSMNLQVIREGLLRHAWTDAQLAELEKRLASVDLLAGIQHATRAERTLTLGSLDYARRNAWGFDVVNWVGDSEGRCSALNIVVWTMPRGWFYQNMVNASLLIQDHALPGVDVQARRVVPRTVDPAGERLEQLKWSPCGFLAGIFHPAVMGAQKKIGKSQTWVDSARLACALERHRLAQGRLPDTLEALVPGFIGKLPHDLITGQPLHYRTNADGGYLIYSVGWNQTDDQGQNARSIRDTGVKDTGQDDWAWLMPR